MAPAARSSTGEAYGDNSLLGSQRQTFTGHVNKKQYVKVSEKVRIYIYTMQTIHILIYIYIYRTYTND